jgi:hypothetical protein
MSRSYIGLHALPAFNGPLLKTGCASPTLPRRRGLASVNINAGPLRISLNFVHSLRQFLLFPFFKVLPLMNTKTVLRCMKAEASISEKNPS